MNGSNSVEELESPQTQDVSLYVPWNGSRYFIEEFESFASKRHKNLEHFHSLRSSIQKASLFQITSPVKQTCLNRHAHYQNVSKKVQQAVGQSTADHKILAEKEALLLKEISKVNANTDSLNIDVAKHGQQLDKVMESYQAHKTALKKAKKVYDSSFGMHVEVTKGQCDNEFIATIRFDHKHDFPAKLTVNRAHNDIIDIEFEFSITPEDKQDFIRQLEHNSYLMFCTKLRKFIEVKCK